MAKFITANRTLSAALVADSLCKIRKIKIIDQTIKDLIDKLLLEKTTLAGIELKGFRMRLLLDEQ